MSTPQPLGPRPSTGIWSSSAAKGEIIIRIFATVITLIALIFLAIGLGFINTNAATQLPHVSNCSIDIESIDPNYLRRSVKIYTGSFVAALSVAIIYQLLAIVIRFLNIGFINSYSKCLIRFDIVVNTIFMTVIVGGIVGAYLLAWLWSGYLRAVRTQLENDYSADVRRSAAGVSAGLWGAFGTFAGAFYQYYNIVTHMVAFIARGRDCCNERVTEHNMEEFKSNQ